MKTGACPARPVHMVNVCFYQVSPVFAVKAIFLVMYRRENLPKWFRLATVRFGFLAETFKLISSVCVFFCLFVCLFETGSYFTHPGWPEHTM